MSLDLSPVAVPSQPRSGMPRPQRRPGRAARDLESLRAPFADDFAAVDELMAEHLAPRDEVGRGIALLASTPGKRLRPLCVLSAAALGAAPALARHALAAAVELVHSATLLHDDLIDGSGQRRGRPTTCAAHGAPVAVLAGDRLLVAGLGLAARAGLPGVVDELMRTVQAMIDAESLQLEWRGRGDVTRATALQIADGKSAGLFRWSLWSGGRAAGLVDSECEALATLGTGLGMAYQMADDLADISGPPERLGDDLRDGVPNLPLIIAFERAPALRSAYEEVVAAGMNDRLAVRHLLGGVQRTAATIEVRDLVRSRLAQSVSALSELPAGAARRHLEDLVAALAERLAR